MLTPKIAKINVAKSAKKKQIAKFNVAKFKNFNLFSKNANM